MAGHHPATRSSPPLEPKFFRGSALPPQAVALVAVEEARERRGPRLELVGDSIPTAHTVRVGESSPHFTRFLTIKTIPESSSHL